jgi:hypothetical protein
LARQTGSRNVVEMRGEIGITTRQRDNARFHAFFSELRDGRQDVGSHVGNTDDGSQ